MSDVVVDCIGSSLEKAPPWRSLDARRGVRLFLDEKGGLARPAEMMSTQNRALAFLAAGREHGQEVVGGAAGRGPRVVDEVDLRVVSWPYGNLEASPRRAPRKHQR